MINDATNMSGWQPIATRPVGVDILVYFPNPNIGQTVARYVVDDECGHCTGWHSSIVDPELCYREPFSDDEKPTHWQPLPEPPK